MIAQELAELANSTFRFKRRGSPLPADRRPLYRISMLLLLLDRCSRGGKSSLPRLQILDWAARDSGGLRALESFLDGDLAQVYAPVRLDPSFIRALNFTVALRLVTHAKGRVQLTEEGRSYLKKITEDGDLSLGSSASEVVGRKFLESQVKSFLERRQ